MFTRRACKWMCVHMRARGCERAWARGHTCACTRAYVCVGTRLRASTYAAKVSDYHKC